MNPIFLKFTLFNKTLEIRYYGMMYAIAFLVAIYSLRKSAKKLSIKPEVMENFAFTAIVSGLIGARLYYVLLRFSPLSIIILIKIAFASLSVKCFVIFVLLS